MVSVTLLSVFGSFTLFTNVLATLFMTSPTASTTCVGGKTCTISWIDDGKAPSLAQFGTADFGIWVGSVQTQIELQPIQQGVNVATTAAIQFTVNPSIGPNSGDYFIKVTSNSLQLPGPPPQPAEAFSAKFALSSMTGTFNSTVQGLINGASSAPIPTPTPPASLSSTPAATSTPATSASAKSNGTASAAGAAKTGAAVPISTKSSLISLVGAALTFAFAL